MTLMARSEERGPIERARSGVIEPAAEGNGPIRRLHAKATPMLFCQSCDRTTEHNETSGSISCKICGDVELLQLDAASSLAEPILREPVTAGAMPPKRPASKRRIGGGRK